MGSDLGDQQDGCVVSIRPAATRRTQRRRGRGIQQMEEQQEISVYPYARRAQVALTRDGTRCSKDRHYSIFNAYEEDATTVDLS